MFFTNETRLLMYKKIIIMSKKSVATILLCLSMVCSLSAQQSTPFTHYKLSNGLSVFLWEDDNQPDVSGTVLFNVGSLDEPEEYSGLAHYLEHVLFKGTQKIGSLDWEKEKPLYEQVIKLYDEFSATTDKDKRAEIEKKINEISIEAAQYARTNEFSELVDGMGGEGLNAGTSYDMTTYYNSFPAYQMEKWLNLYSERFINPVFRSFQAELENVFEEYNMYQDSPNTHTQNFLFSHLYAGHPYSRNVIGSPENLKNPKLGKLIEFYNTWYVPENMALILVGNFDSEVAKPLIEKTFARLPAKKSPQRTVHAKTEFDKDRKYSAKLSFYPQIFWGYKGLSRNHKDAFMLDFCTQLLSNSSNTGLLDKLTLNGDVLQAGAILDSRKDDGRVLIFAIPYYDVNQRVYESDRATEKIVMTEVDKLKNGEVEDWLIQSVKDNLLREHKLIMETPQMKTNILSELFIYGLPLDYYETIADKVNAVTKEDVQETVKKYFSGNKITVSILQGKPKKTKLNKPDIKPIEQPKTGLSAYGKSLQDIPVVPVDETYNNFADVKKVKLYDGVTLHYTENKINDIFTLDLRYGIGTHKMPKLEYATPLMNSAGIMPSDDAQTVRRQFSELSSQCTYRVNDSYFTISLLGEEKNLEQVCKLMTMQVLLPKLDDKQLNRVKGNVYNARQYETENTSDMGRALLEYALYGEKSSYIDRMELMDVIEAKIFELTGDVIRATEYELDIFYVGAKPIGEVVETLKANLPLKEGVNVSESPIVQERVTYDKPTILFLPNKDAQQAKIYFYTQGPAYNIDDDVYYEAFYNYLSGGFNGLLMQEIRENNSMAYTTFGRVIAPPIQGKNAYFLGFIGTQPDKSADAIDLFMKIINDIPKYPERIENIKTNLRQSNLTNKPSFRKKGQVFDRWQKMGYADDPAKINMPKIDSLTFDNVMSFYNNNVKGKPMTIVIMADPKKIDLKQIKANHGKITKVNSSKLFSQE